LNPQIQSLEEDKDDSGNDNDKLDAIMAFLQTTYIAMYALFSPTLGLYADKVFKANGDMHEVVQNIACILFTIIAAITFAATFVPRGACDWNPKALEHRIADAKGTPEMPILEKGEGKGKGEIIQIELDKPSGSSLGTSERHFQLSS